MGTIARLRRALALSLRDNQILVGAVAGVGSSRTLLSGSCPTNADYPGHTPPYNEGSSQQRAPAQPGPDRLGEPQRNQGSIAASPGKITSLRFVRDHLWRRFAHFKLGAHFLDLGRLLFELRGENLHPFLLLRDR